MIEEDVSAGHTRGPTLLEGSSAERRDRDNRPLFRLPHEQPNEAAVEISLRPFEIQKIGFTKARLDSDDEDRLQAAEALESLSRGIAVGIRPESKPTWRLEVFAVDDVRFAATLRHILFER